MKIHHITTTFLDYPGKTSMLVFTAGCKRHCYGCQNPELKDFHNGTSYNFTELFAEFQKRPMCNAICFTGGDPLYQPDLAMIAGEFKKCGIRVGIYTGATFESIDKKILDCATFIKTDKYNASLGGLDSDATNQRCWIKVDGQFIQKPWKELKDERNQI